MNKAIELIKQLIKEHYEQGYADNDTFVTNALDHGNIEEALNDQYDVARYETLVNLLHDLEKIGT